MKTCTKLHNEKPNNLVKINISPLKQWSMRLTDNNMNSLGMEPKVVPRNFK